MKKIIIMAIFASLLFLSPFLLSQGDKLRVTAERVYIHISPDINSPVIEMVEKGAILTLLSPEKKREHWYYISYYSETKRIMVSGFIHASSVRRTVETPKVFTEAQRMPSDRKVIIYKSPGLIQVILEQANVRTEPNFKSDIIHQVQFGISLQTVEKRGEWYKVNLLPDEQGNVVAGYIHQSFVQIIEEVGPAEIKEEEPAISPQSTDGTAKGDEYVKVGLNYLIFSESSLRDTYGEGIGYEAEISFGVWKNFEAWLGSTYFFKRKSGNSVKMFPVEAGVKYGLSKGKFNFYWGLGINYYKYEESTPTLDVSVGGIGYTAKLGSYVKIIKESLIDFQLNYSYCRIESDGSRKNIGGIELGIGIGYMF